MADRDIDNGSVAPGQKVVVGVASGTNNLYLGNTVTNQGTIELTGSGPNNSSNLVIGVPTQQAATTDYNVILTGGGVVVGDDVAGNAIGTVSEGGFSGGFAGSLDNVNNVIEGSLTIANTGSGGNPFLITNEKAGTINATGTSNQFVISNGITNNGLIEDTGTAGLILNSQRVLDQTGGGTLQAVGSGAHVNLDGFTVVGGTLAASGGGVIQVDGIYSTSDTLDGTKGAVTLTAGSPLNIAPGASLAFTGAFQNSGLVTVAGTSANGSSIVFSGTSSLSGGGQIVLADNTAANNAIGANGTTSLDNVDNTISGSGFITGVTLTNESKGVINANVADRLVLNTNTVNNGLIEDTGTGSLGLQSITVDQTGGGTLAANGAGSLVILNQSTVAGGTISTTAGGQIQVIPSNNNSVLDGTKGAVTLTAGSALQVNAGNGNLELTGAIQNQGVITVAGTNNAGSAVQFGGATTLTGGGALVLADDTSRNNAIGSVSGGVTIDNVDNTISGAGFVTGGIAITNESKGVVNANVADALVLNDNITNNGLIEDTGTGSLGLQSITVDQTGGGTLAANGAGAVVLLNQSTVMGGTLSTTAGGQIQVIASNNDSMLDGTKGAVTLTAGSALQVNAGSTNLELTGAIHNQGVITVAGINNAGSVLKFAGATTLSGGGSIVLADDTAVNNALVGTGGAVTVDNVDNTIGGAGIIGGGIAITNESAGIIDANGVDQIVLQDAVTNNGLLESTIGQLNVQANVDQSGGGTIAANGAGSVVNFYNTTITSGVLTTSAGGTFTVSPQANVTFNGSATLTSASNLVVEGGATLNIAQTAALGGSLEVDGNLFVDGNMRAGQAINALTGSGQVIAFDSTNPAQPEAVTLTVGGNGSSSSFSGLITEQGSASLGLVKTGAGSLTLAAANRYSGGTTISGGTLDLAVAGAASGGAITFAGSANASATLSLESAAQPASGGAFGNTLAAFGNNDALDLRGLTFTNALGATFNPLNNQLTVNENGITEAFTLSNPGAAAYFAHDDGQGGTVITDSAAAVCFCSGTRIATVRGEIAVENLVIGDEVITSSGSCRPIRWLGNRSMDPRRQSRPQEAQPIRIGAGAFGETRPARDLRLSPGHAICVDVLGEVLMTAGSLVNGTTIVQEEVDHVTYWHIELEGGHNIILAENLPCESYLDMGNRGFFAQAGVVALDASPDVRPEARSHADFCRPFHGDGPVLNFVRERLAARACQLGWHLAQEPFAGLYLEVDGRRVEAETSGLAARFFIPAGAKALWLVSQTSVPAEIGAGSDLRRLGVCVGSVVIDDGFGTPRTIMVDDPRLAVGFSHVEEGPQRWTCGRALLPVELWQERKTSFFLRVELTQPALSRWILPEVRLSTRRTRFG